LSFIGAAGPIAEQGNRLFSPAAAYVGPMSTTKYFSRQLGNVLSFAPGNTIGVFWWHDSTPAATENIFGCNTSTSGLEMQVNSAANMFFVSRNAGAPVTFNFGTARFGLMANIFTRKTATGELRAVFNGGPAQSLSATLPSYVAPSATAVLAFGHNNPAINNNPLTNGKVLCAFAIGAEMSDTDMRLATSLTRLDRFHPSPLILQHASLLWQLDFGRDWNGIAATVTAGLGSAPVTVDALGSPFPTKTSVPRYSYKDYSEGVMHNSRIYSFGAAQQETPHYRHNAFAVRKFVTDTDLMTVDFAVTASTIQPGYLGPGIRVNGSWVATPIVGQYQMDGSRDVSLGTLGTSKTVEIVDGIGNYDGPDVTCVAGIAVRIPEGQSFAPVLPSTPADVIGMIGDSITVGSKSTDVQQDSYFIKTRNNFSARSVFCYGWGALALWDLASTSGDRTTLATAIAQYLNATGTNKFCHELGLNDWLLNKTSPTNYLTALGWLDTLHSLVPGAQVFLRTMLWNVNQAVANGSGFVLQQYRDACATFQSTRSSWVTLVDGPSMATAVSSFDADGTHLNNTGSTQVAAAWQAVL